MIKLLILGVVIYFAIRILLGLWRFRLTYRSFRDKLQAGNQEFSPQGHRNEKDITDKVRPLD